MAVAATRAMCNPHQIIGELIIDETAVEAVRICGQLDMAAVTMEQMVTPTVATLMASVISIHASKRVESIKEGDINKELYNNHHGNEIISRLQATQQQRNAGYQH